MKRNHFKASLVLALALIMAMTAMTACGGKGGKSDKNDKEQTYKWKLQSSYGPGDQTWDIQMPMIVDAIEKASNGRIKITTYQPDAICAPEQAPESVKNGLLECALSAGADDAVIVPAAISELGIPYYWETGQDMYQTYYEYGLLDYLRKEYEKQGIYFGMEVPNGVYSLMTKFPVNKASDLKGKKIRAYGSWGTFVDKLGGSPVSMPGGEIYQGLKLGTIDGTIYSFAELQNMKLSEVTQYVTDPPASGSAFVNMIISKKAWDKLPKDLQDAVNKALQDVYEPVRAACIKYDEEAKAFAESKGVKIIKLDPKEMEAFWKAGEETAKSVEAQYPDAKGGLDIIRKWHKEVKETKK